MEALHFYKCASCGRVVALWGNGEETVATSNGPMEKLTANTSEGASEKHLPEVTCHGDEITVQAGSILHPATQEHYIGFIALETEQGVQIRQLNGTQSPVVKFVKCDDRPVAAYVYCNLHGLWKSEVHC